MANKIAASELRVATWLQHLLANRIGMDRAIFFTVLARFWAACYGIVNLVLIARFLSPAQQGYYYTFYSIVALQIVFELGFSFVILQLAAHERAYLTFLPQGGVEGDPVAHSRLASILQKAVYWYMAMGILMAAVLVPAGIFFFSTHQKAGDNIAWQTPWCALVLVAMLAFQIDPVFSFIEGCGFVAEVAQRRFTQAILGSVLAWAAMILHYGLFAPALFILGQVIVGLGYLLSRRHYKFLRNLLTFPVREHFVGWRKEIWPFQWKIAISWMCGYFIYQLFSPVLFAFQGPVAAGRMGMSLQIATGIGSIAIAWMNTKASPFGALVARRDYGQLDHLFFHTLKQSTALLTFGCALFLGLLIAFGHSVPHFASRLLPAWVIGIMLVNTILNHIVYSQALYLRAHKQEPFLWQAIISAILIGSLTVFLGKYYGASAVVVGVFVQGILFGLPYASHIFASKRLAWHAVSQPAAQPAVTGRIGGGAE